MADVNVVFPQDLGKTLEWGGGEPKKWNVKLSKVKGNQLRLEADGLAYSQEAPPNIANLFISNDGDDNNDGTRTRPLRTIREAFKRKPGYITTTIHLHEGQTFDINQAARRLHELKGVTFVPYGDNVDLARQHNPAGNGIYWAAHYINRPTIRFMPDEPTDRPTKWDALIQDDNAGLKWAFQACVLDFTATVPGKQRSHTGWFGWHTTPTYLDFQWCDLKLATATTDGAYALWQFGPQNTVKISGCRLVSGNRLVYHSAGPLNLLINNTPANNGKLIPNQRNNGTMKYAEVSPKSAFTSAVTGYDNTMKLSKVIFEL